VTLIDCRFNESKVRLICFCICRTRNVYLEGEGPLSFERTASASARNAGEGWGRLIALPAP